MIRLVIAVLAAGCAAAAQDAPGSAAREARVPGILEYHAEAAQDAIDAPAEVRAGEEFVVTIRTFGSGCERAGDTGAIVDRSAAAVMVYDITTATGPGVVCTMILKRMEHQATLRFEQPGTATIRIWGRRVRPGLPPAGEPLVLERRITVR